jgi:hypothetical protein
LPGRLHARNLLEQAMNAGPVQHRLTGRHTRVSGLVRLQASLLGQFASVRKQPGPPTQQMASV